jgi:uncharacterized membrane protein
VRFHVHIAFLGYPVSTLARIGARENNAMRYESFVIEAGHVIELAGVAVLCGGALLAAGAFARRLSGPATFEQAYQALRADLGRAILLGLELLVIGDIIGTVIVEPDLDNLAVLALIVAIRTFLSVVLELEVSGHWPWERGRRRRDRATNEGG